MPRTQCRLSDAIDAYLRHRRSRGLKHNTIRNDECYLSQFLAAVGNIYCRSVEPRHVDHFFEDNPQWSQPSRNLIATVLRGFFSYCRRQRWLDKDVDPVADYSRVKTQRQERLRVPVAEFPALLDAAGVEHPRNRMIVALGLFLFLRGSEMKTIRLGDVNLTSGEVAVVIHKSTDADVMRINTQLDREFRSYLSWYKVHHPEMDPEWYLVPSKEAPPPIPGVKPGIAPLRPNRQISNPQLVVQSALAAVGYPIYRQGVHTLRRSGARAFYNELCARQGDDSALEVVSAMLHHSNLVITQLYLGIRESRKRRDRAVLDGPMFPSLEAGNVIRLREAAGGG